MNALARIKLHAARRAFVALIAPDPSLVELSDMGHALPYPESTPGWLDAWEAFCWTASDDADLGACWALVVLQALVVRAAGQPAETSDADVSNFQAMAA
jgi:hypothetical protein